MKPLKNRYLLFCSVALLLLCQHANSQTPTVGIKAGISISNSPFEYNNGYPPYGREDVSSRLGILIGVYGDFSLGKHASFRPGVELVPKGNKNIYGSGQITYLDFPLNLLYKMKQPGGAFMFGGGPTIGIPYNQSNTYKTDVGINGVAGFEFPIGFGINLNYTYGLLNISKNTNYATKVLNRYLGLTLVYTF